MRCPACLRAAGRARAERWKFSRYPLPAPRDARPPMTSSPIPAARSQYLLDLLAQVPNPRMRRGRRHALAGPLAVGDAAVSPEPQGPSRLRRARRHPGQGTKTREAPVREAGCGNHTSRREPHPSRRQPVQQARGQERSQRATEGRPSSQPVHFWFGVGPQVYCVIGALSAWLPPLVMHLPDVPFTSVLG
jgi:hypothetical protein